jgi:hypothetical protein
VAHTPRYEFEGVSLGWVIFKQRWISNKSDEYRRRLGLAYFVTFPSRTNRDLLVLASRVFNRIIQIQQVPSG